MKKIILLILLIGALFIISCKDVVVHYPIPLTLRAKFLIGASGGSFSENLLVDTDTLFMDLQKELDRLGLTWNDIDRIRLEGAAYTVYDPTEDNVVVNGTCDVAYLSPSFVHTLTLSNFDLTVNEGITKVDPLTPDGVTLLNDIWDDFLRALKINPGVNPSLLVGVRAAGSLSSQQNLTFTMVVEFTTTAVVKQKQKTFNIFG
jgi:hypothetical protein